MAHMFEGFKKLYTGRNAFSRQLTLFSICGIIGLIYGYILLENFNSSALVQKILLTLVLVIFGMFLVGYEIKFMHEKYIPEIETDSFKLALNKYPALVFAVGVLILLISLFTKYDIQMFWVEMFLAVPLTMLQAGFSVNYKNSDVMLFYEKFNLTDCIKLFLKRLWVVIIGYSAAFGIIFVTLLIVGIVLVLVYSGDSSQVVLTISRHQNEILKLSVYAVSILLVYFLTVGTLIWDYELINVGRDA